jgi:hypothetical protein
MGFLVVFFLGVQEDELEALERKLRSDRIEEREEAERGVAKVGRKAKSLLERLARDEDTEVRERAQSILTGMNSAWGLETLDALQRGLEGAKTLRVQLKDEGTPGAVRCSGLLLMEGANRAYLRLEAEVPGSLKGTCVFVSNGTSMKYKLSTSNPAGELRAQGHAPEQLNRTLIRALLRAGPLFPLRAIRPAVVAAGNGTRESSCLVMSQETLLDASPSGGALSKVSWGGEGRKWSFSYTIADDAIPEDNPSALLGRVVSGPASVTWEYDPETFAPTRRKFQVPLSQGWSRVDVGVREDYAFDVDMPAFTFDSSDLETPRPLTRTAPPPKIKYRYSWDR